MKYFTQKNSLNHRFIDREKDLWYLLYSNRETGEKMKLFHNSALITERAARLSVFIDTGSGLLRAFLEESEERPEKRKIR